MVETEKKLYKVTGLDSEKLTLLMRKHKDVQLTSDRSLCFVRIPAAQEKDLIELCQALDTGLHARYAGWRQLVPKDR